jgi:hypothetical protein
MINPWLNEDWTSAVNDNDCVGIDSGNSLDQRITTVPSSQFVPANQITQRVRT